jgi:DNA-binding transcriptional MerR regulator
MTTAKKDPSQTSGELFPIRTVASLTGVNAITLRAWERRYGLIRPVRTPTGHRLYRRDEIDLIHRVVAQLDKGISISQVRRALDHAAPGNELPEGSPGQRYQKRMIAAITRFDDEELEDIYNDAMSVHPIEQVTLQVLIPLLQELGERWESTAGTIAEEHFFGVYLRNKLGARFHHRPRSKNGPRLLSACLPGEQHEIGFLLFALTAFEHDLRPVLLGANMPLSELPAAVKRAQCQAIVLSGSMSPAASVLAEDLPALVAAAGVPVFVGGMASVRERDAIVSAGAIPLGNELNRGAQRIHDAL